MEAIAHSPSFAKKVHIPQSVGKDFAEADKGKTFKRGGDMKGDMASKMKMFEKSGKDIEKKGMKEGSKADMALDKKQMMKAGGKVRRMAAGGTGDPFELSNEDLANYEKNGAKNLKNLKNFFGFGEQEPAPIDRSRDVVAKPKPTESAVYTPRPPLGITKLNIQSPRTSSGNSAAEDAVEREDAAARVSRTALDEADKQKKNAMDAFNPALAEAQMQAQRAKDAFKPKPRKPVGKPVGIEKTEKKERVITEPVKKIDTRVNFSSELRDKPAIETHPQKLEGLEELMKPKRKFGMASDETRASVRKGLGSVLDFFDLSKAHEKEFGKKYAKGGNVQETMGPRTMSKDVETGSNKNRAFGEHAIQKRGKTRDLEEKMPKFAKGGMVSSRGDGIAQRGRTRGKLC